MPFSSLAAAVSQIKKDVASTERRMQTAVKKAARQTRNHVARELVPVAFGELRDSIKVRDVEHGHSDVFTDAPHAAAVEVGSRPHMPPLEPLIRWVRLRGLQGLTAHGNMKTTKGRRNGDGTRSIPSTDWRKDAARGVARELQDRLGQSGAAAWHARAKGDEASALADPDTIAVARAIQAKIAKSGTKPNRFMMAATGPAEDYLAQFVTAAIPHDPGT